MNGSIIPVNNGIVETNTITIVGMINVTGNVVVASEMSVKLSNGSVLHVEKCLILEKGSEVIVIVNEMSSNGNVLAAYDAECSSPGLVEQVRIETTSFDECLNGRPKVEEMKNNDSGRAQLVLLFVPIDQIDDETVMCSSNDREIDKILVIAIVVPIAVVVIVAIVIAVTVSRLRAKKKL